MRKRIRLVTFALCLLSAASEAGAQEVASVGDEALDGLFSAFVTGDADARVDAVRTFAALDREDRREVLEGILNADLMLQKRERRVVWAKRQGREYLISDVPSREPIETVSKRRLKRLPLDNRLRTTLKGVIASLGLRSEDPVRRLRAAESLLARPDSVDADILEELIGSENDPSVSDSLLQVQAMQRVQSEVADDRLRAIATLGANLSPESRRAIAGLADDDPDEAVRAAAAKAETRQAARVRWFGFLETAFFGLSLGSVLVLAAIGLAITFGVMGVINMAHGELIMIGAYSAWAMQQLMPQSLGLALLLSLPVAFAVSGLTGMAIERGVIRFLYGRPLETLLATFGVSLILQQLARSLISSQNVSVANPAFMSGTLTFNSAFSLTLNRLYILAFCLIVFAVLLMLLRGTRLGLEVRAVAQNRAMASAMGVPAARVDALTFGLGSGIAGVAGVALSQLTNVGPNLGQAYIVDSFMVVVFGGVGNLWGTLIGGMTLGVANKLAEPWAGAILAKILVLVFLIAFIQKRPRGLFPQRGRAVEA